jgi:MscS family membrane protein
MDIVKEAGTGFAFPSQTTYFSKDTGLDAEKSRVAEAQVEDWRTKGKRKRNKLIAKYEK